ncbi:hypothetical protein IQ13_0938 [Lacibacter cauensis]|uniref:Uncharacterized protein n=1 Tax=Lacibacter cauensis TaxID=510947 RepID=A0A562SYQ6_9BACT|nr:hypothetical protein [Lacibacter cauensis]TWI85770.1 hypothetical protein IQ13_0938 [Lacibacter cauensis]
MKDFFLLVGLITALVYTNPLHAQKSDTIRITKQHLQTGVLREGTHRYLVYAKMKKDSVRILTQFWTRTIKRTIHNGLPVIEISQEWEDQDSVMHKVVSRCDAVTMKPLYHQSWWKTAASRGAPVKTTTETIVDFINGALLYNGKQLSAADTAQREQLIRKGFESAQHAPYFLNWHLDLETFPLLPFKNGLTFILPFYDPGTPSGVKEVAYTVSGSGTLTGYNDQQIDCWLLIHETQGNKEVFWISKRTKEVLKLEQEINGRVYRYKIKLGFSY